MPEAREANTSSEGNRSVRRRLYEILEEATPSDRAGKLVDRFLVALIIVNLAALVLESDPKFDAVYHGAFALIEFGSLAAFSIEYLMRIWVAPESTAPSGMRRRRARLNYMLSGPGIVDLLSVLPFLLSLFLTADLRAVLVFRFLRFLKLVRYSPAMRSLLDALYAERRALLGCAAILIGTTLIAASLVFTGFTAVSAEASAHGWKRSHPARAQVNHRIARQHVRITHQVRQGDMSRTVARGLRCPRSRDSASAPRFSGSGFLRESVASEPNCR